MAFSSEDCENGGKSGISEEAFLRQSFTHFACRCFCTLPEYIHYSEFKVCEHRTLFSWHVYHSCKVMTVRKLLKKFINVFIRFSVKTQIISDKGNLVSNELKYVVVIKNIIKLKTLLNSIIINFLPNSQIFLIKKFLFFKGHVKKFIFTRPVMKYTALLLSRASKSVLRTDP